MDKPFPAGASIGFIEIEFNENYTINDTSPVILYLDAYKIYNFPYCFYAPKNIVYLVDSKGNVYKISEKLKAELYEMQKCRQNAKEVIDILWKYSLF